MKRKNRRRLRQCATRVAVDPSSVPTRPEFLHMDDRRLIWRATLRPAPGLPLRPITWDVSLRENGSPSAPISTGRERCGTSISAKCAADSMKFCSRNASPSLLPPNTRTRIRRSLYWQRTPDDGCSHLLPAKFDEATYWWSFSTQTSRQTIDRKFPLDGPVVRPASNQMLLERHEERQWAAYARQRLEWAQKLSLDPDISENLLGSGLICRLRPASTTGRSRSAASCSSPRNQSPPCSARRVSCRSSTILAIAHGRRLSPALPACRVRNGWSASACHPPTRPSDCFCVSNLGDRPPSSR